MNAVGTHVASQLNWTLKDNESGCKSLFFTKDTRYETNQAQIPIWGTAVIFDSRDEAEDSLVDKYGQDSLDLCYVRLVHVADSDLLKRMVDPNEEAVRSKDAGLYIDVAPTCPVYYARWDTRDDAEYTHSVISFLDRGSPRHKLLDLFNDRVAGSNPSPCSLHLHKAVRGGRGDVEMRVNPGVSVVRVGWSDPDHDEAGGDDDAGDGT
eukprot:g13237.t2